jgi:hypothetical protein
MQITQNLQTATVNAVAAALEELNVPKAEAKPLARELILVATAAGQSIDDHLIPWIRQRPKFRPRKGRPGRTL